MSDLIKRNQAAGSNVARVAKALADSGANNNPSYVLIGINESVDNGADSAVAVNASGYVTDSATNQKVKLTSISVNSMVINAQADSVVRFCYTDSSGTLPAQGKALAGTTIAVKITGSTTADSISGMVYMPKNIIGSTSQIPTSGGVSNTSNLTLNWVSDPNNTAGIQIEVMYEGALSQFSNPSLPATDTTLTYTVTDNGSYTISSTALSHYPTGCYVTIIIGRGSQVPVRLPVSGRLVYLQTTSTIMSVPLKVS